MMYYIYGCYQGKWEKVDSAKTFESATYLLREYVMAFGSEWKVEIRFDGKRIDLQEA